MCWEGAEALAAERPVERLAAFLVPAMALGLEAANYKCFLPFKCCLRDLSSVQTTAHNLQYGLAAGWAPWDNNLTCPALYWEGVEALAAEGLVERLAAFLVTAALMVVGGCPAP